MKRFRFTLLAICLLLLWLGGTDLILQLRNPQPATIQLDEILHSGAPREWLTIAGGYQDLDGAISTSGTLDLDALLVPLKRSPDQEQIDLLIETRDPELLALFRDYHFKLDSESDRAAFRAKNADRFNRSRAVTGMLISGLVADNNRHKLEKLATELGMQIEPGILFLAEGKEPGRVRGYFFLGAALLGLVKFFQLMTAARNPGK